MRIYIIEDDSTVISILVDLVEQNDLGTVCGDTADAPPDLEGILAADPDLILVDLLMPGKDGIQVVRELKEGGSRAKFIMISQVSAKEMVARAYSAGVDFFIQKPINLIEVRQVIQNVSRQIENEQALRAIQSVFAGRAPAPPPEPPLSRDNPKTMEQRARRALDRGLNHIASLGVEDYTNEFFTRYSARLFPFQEVRAEMAHLQGKGPGGKANLRTFLDGLLVLTDED